MATTILPTYNYTTGTSDAIPTSLPMANAYKYDQLNRIAQSNSFTNFDATGNNWTNTGAIANMYKTSYTYDANGNIKNLQRYNAAGVKFDDMDYKYDVQGSNLISNKLYHVNDAIASGIHTADIDDQLGFTTTNITTSNNYTYDEIGNLKQDKTEEILEIKWTVSGKIKKIIRTGISTKPDLEYVYDAMGNRIAKILKPDGSSLENGGTNNPTLWTYTYYVRDAQGNIMANYQKSTTNSITSFKLIERSIYGSSRLGIDKTTIDLTASTTTPTILNHNLGLKNYELSNHLGNVTTVISDRKIPRSVLGANIDFYMPDIVSATDYYPFGMTMQERTYSAGVEAYRYGFNGKENDNEISVDGGNLDFGARIYDSRLGRWLSVDPLLAKFSSFSPYNYVMNNPLFFIDKNGEEPIKPSVTNLAALIQVLRSNNIRNLDEAATFMGGNQHPFTGSVGASSTRGVGESNRYIYTSGAGWLDLRHFFDAGDLASNHIFSFAKVLEKGEGVEESQLRSGDGSAYDYEDLQSNLQGAIFGNEFGDLQGEDFYNALEKRMAELGAVEPTEAPNYVSLKDNYHTDSGVSVTGYTPVYAPNFLNLPSNLTKGGYQTLINAPPPNVPNEAQQLIDAQRLLDARDGGK